MSRLSWIVIALMIAGGLVAVYLARTANKELQPYLGKWSGAFEARTPADTVNGFLQLYASNDKFTMHLEGPQQEIDVKGTWKILRPGRIEVKPTEVKINDFGGADRRDPNKPYLPDDGVRNAYAKPLIFDLSKDGEYLEGLLLSIGPVNGVHKFKKGFGNVR